MNERVLNLIGLALNLVGVLILFRYGMPFHVPTKGAVHLILEQTDDAEIELERRYEIYGYWPYFLNCRNDLADGGRLAIRLATF